MPGRAFVFVESFVSNVHFCIISRPALAVYCSIVKSNRYFFPPLEAPGVMVSNSEIPFVVVVALHIE